MGAYVITLETSFGTFKEQRLSDKQARNRYINYHSMPFFPYDTKRKEFVFDANHNLLAEMEKES